MKDFLSGIIDRTSEFGNHYNKYVRNISQNLDLLIRRLEDEKKRDTVHFLHPAYDFKSELKIVASIGTTSEEKLKLLGSFFSLQFLLMNHQAIDLLKIEVMDSEADRISVYKDFMLTVGNKFRTLTANYINELLNIFSDRDYPEFVILGVGTRSDQDDIDVGIIDDGRGNREKFNRTIALISREMLRYATTFHFHLSEHIGSQYYSASIDEYKKVLRHEIRDFVIINEMLSGARIIGSKKIYEKYRKEVIDRYFYHTQGNNQYHEGYLRGILGEISLLMARPISTTHINFKEDALRVIKSIISVQKTIFKSEKHNAWEIIDDLKTKDAKRHHEYNALEQSLTFFEIFRYLYQLFVTQDEEIILDETSLKNINQVAKVLGYTNIGRCHAGDHLLVHYYEHVQNIRTVVPKFLNEVKTHLKEHSVFSPMFNLNYKGNIAQDFIQKFQFFRGTSFWDDILDDFKNETQLKRFVDDINSLSSVNKKQIIEKYIEWVKYDFYSLIKFLTTLGKSKTGHIVYEDLNKHLLNIIDQIPDVVRNIAYVFYRFPNLINNYLSLNDEKTLRFYHKLLEEKIYEEEINQIIENLKYLIEIHRSSSKFFKRFYLRILDKYPEAIKMLRDPHRLVELANGICSDISVMKTFEDRKEILGDYYDFEIMRVGINTLNGAPVRQTNIEYINFSDNYINTLFDICRQEVDTEYKKRIITEDLLAIFAAGGHAREQAFDDDYDIIVLLNSQDPKVLSYCNKIVAKMNAEIIKRGTIPHHRFAEYFGRYVITLKEIEQLLGEKRPNIFIEKSQILGARLIIGSHRFEKEFLERIVKPYIFNQKRDYTAQMIQEIKSRHEMIKQDIVDSDNDIKEGAGGLRDIEMVMLILKAQFNIKQPVSSKLFKDIAACQSNLKSDLQKLERAFSFLKNLRDLYRLTAGASDVILPQALDTAANIMAYKSSTQLYNDFKKITADTTRTITNLIDKLQNND
jgi:hypothetical protein